ncbi:hypothetical protein BKA70DRAFT_1224410 [Coprinopsis sp. MPI-PUGE-AT-0042]|nr:hypothetical protein BKA70DRAFT_1466187 [Coprinopsis sp. MPI-PUGE-AT-0042]KAH6906589.1 hypothetical protein BKA70DRAFT_1224410 [Coprinopsis sp. MPI-PUGE-AT-0042]
MKFTAAAAVLSLAASTLAYPLYERSLELDDEYALAARDVEYQEYLDARFDDFIDYLEARVGEFKTDLTKAQKQEAHASIEGAKKGGQIGSAAAPGFHHLDRQQPTNAAGSHKVAVQMTGHRRPGDSSTVAQVNIEPHGRGKQPAGARVAARLKHSLNTGKEQAVRPTTKAGRIAANQAAQQAKKDRNSKKQADGNARAVAG